MNNALLSLDSLADTVPQHTYQALLRERDALVIKNRELLHEHRNMARLVHDMEEQADQRPETDRVSVWEGALLTAAGLIVCGEFWYRVGPMLARAAGFVYHLFV